MESISFPLFLLTSASYARAMSISTQPPSGFRDFLNESAANRSDLIEIISNVYRSFGFSPLETPALENLNILLGSGGQENEKLIFKVLKRGEKLKEILKADLELSEERLADFGLRFDLTVPLCRAVAEYRGQVQLPWKVFHIGQVWRAERAQKGRFREFTQCDVDIIGSKSTAAELEVIQAVVVAVHAAGADGFDLHLNDRRLLQWIAEKNGFVGEKANAFFIALDKKDKVSPEELLGEVEQILLEKPTDQIERLFREGLSLSEIQSLAPEVSSALQLLIEQLQQLDLPLKSVRFDSSLARGMSYYTGTIFELRHPSAGYSLGGGGRYDDLIGRFTKQSIPACGFSIGFDRLLLLLAEKKAGKKRARLFIPVFSEDLRVQLVKMASGIRSVGVDVDVYPDTAKLKNQFKFASESKHQWVLIAGESEFAARVFKLKDLASGEEKEISESEVLPHLKKLFSRP